MTVTADDLNHAISSVIQAGVFWERARMKLAPARIVEMRRIKGGVSSELPASGVM